MPPSFGREKLLINSPTQLQYSVLKLIFPVSATTCASSVFFQDLSCNVLFKFCQPTSMRCLCCFYYRNEYMPVVKSHTNCSRYQGFPNVHCWCKWIYCSLLLDRIRTLPCQKEILFGTQILFFGL